MKLKINLRLNDGKPIKNSKDLMKIRFYSDDDLPLGKILIIPILSIVVKFVFKNDKYYPQVYIDECGYEL